MANLPTDTSESEDTASAFELGAYAAARARALEQAQQQVAQDRAARFAFVAGAVLAMLGVMLGAFGAHGLRERVSADLLVIFETGARYQMYHALALLGVAGATATGFLRPRPSLWISALFIVGVVVFSGSLYALVLTEVRRWGAVTPFGGVMQIVGWAMFAWFAATGRQRQ